MKRFLILVLLIAALVPAPPVPAPAAEAGPRVDREVLLARQQAADQGLFHALAENDLAGLVTLRDQGADPNASLTRLGLRTVDVFPDASVIVLPFDPRGWPILHWAVYLDNPEAVKALLRAGARVNAPDIRGATALHWAAWGGRSGAARVLLDNGADCRAEDTKRRTPKDWAIMMGQDALIRLLDDRVCQPPPIRDADADGVPDDQDRCPSTPYGAPADDQGCWVAAYPAFFDSGRAEVKSRYVPYILDAARILKDHPGLSVEIRGCAEAAGSGEDGLALARRRAEAVARILTDNGIDADRLRLTSRGDSEPAGAEAGGRAQGRRRVEIHVEP